MMRGAASFEALALFVSWPPPRSPPLVSNALDERALVLAARLTITLVGERWRWRQQSTAPPRV